MADDNFAETALAEKPDTRPICSAQTPAPKGRQTSGAYSFGSHRWDWNWQHPDANEREINADHGDIRCDACYDMNSIADLEHALTFDEADATDCATWNLTPAQWREQIELALT